jgi:hypothetical protein
LGDSASARPPAEHAVWHSEVKRKGVAGGVALAHTTRHVFMHFLSSKSFLLRFLLIEEGGEVGDGAGEAGQEGGGGVPVEELIGEGDVGLALLGVIAR